MSQIKISLVVTNWNGRDLLKKHLGAVFEAARYWQSRLPASPSSSWEIIVTDDHSTDGSDRFVQTHFPEVGFISSPERLYFAEVCNRGAAAARGEIMILLNNDVSPRRDFIAPLISNFRDPLVFAVGCKELDIRNGRQIWSGRGLTRFERGLMTHRRAENQNKKTTAWATAGSAAYDRKKWLEIGGLDPLFRPAYEEDRDISYRALKHGWKVLFEPESIVEHRHETTNIRAFGPEKIKIISFKNQFLFVWKNAGLKMLLAHFFWLPYHLIFTAFRSKGLLWIGFVKALTQLPEVIRQRINISKSAAKPYSKTPAEKK